MSQTIVGLIVTIVGLILTRLKIPYVTGDVEQMVGLLVSVGGIGWAWYNRVRIGDITPAGARLGGTNVVTMHKEHK